MRPVPTWKSTAAAPTPMRLGPDVVPAAAMPWHVAQLAANSFWPSFTFDCDVALEALFVSAVALDVKSA